MAEATSGDAGTKEAREAHDRLCKAAEERISKILIDLDGAFAEYGLGIDHVNVDTRNFANFGCDIMTAARRRYA